MLANTMGVNSATIGVNNVTMDVNVLMGVGNVTVDVNNCPNITNTSLSVEEYLNNLQDKHNITLIPAVIFMTILSCFGLVGNILVLLVYSRKMKLNPTKVLLMAIACFDLIANVGAIPSEINVMFNSWNFSSRGVCKSKVFLGSFTIVGGAFLLMAVAFIRYRKVCRPHEWQISVYHAKVISGVAVLIGLIFSIPYIILYGIKTRDTPCDKIKGHECFADDYYHDTNLPLLNNLLYGAIYLFFAVSLVVFYSLIAALAWKQNSQWETVGGTRVRKSDINFAQPVQAVNGEVMPPNLLSDPADQRRGRFVFTKMKSVFCCLLNIRNKKSVKGEANSSSTLEMDESSSTPGMEDEESTSHSSPSNPSTSHSGISHLDTSDSNTSHSGASHLETSYSNTSKSNNIEESDQSSTKINHCLAEVPPDSRVPQSPGCSSLETAHENRALDMAEGDQSFRKITSEHAHNSHQILDVANTSNSGASNSYLQQEHVKAANNISKIHKVTSKFVNSVMKKRTRRPSEMTIISFCPDSPESPRRPSEISQSSRRPSAATQSSRRPSEVTQSARKPLNRMTIMLITISAIFVLSYLPFIVLTMFKNRFPKKYLHLNTLEFTFYNLFYRLYFLNTAANPVIYSLCDINFRKECFRLLTCRSRRDSLRRQVIEAFQRR